MPRLCLLLVLAVTKVSGDPLPQPFWPVEYYVSETPADNVGFSNNDMFLLHHARVTHFWEPTKTGPIFFYCGHELPLEDYINNTGLLWNWAKEFKAMIIFSEHRFYGQSLPDDTVPYLNYFSALQALADYAHLILHIKETVHRADKVPVIAFGGFYGGMLAAYFRLKYPHLIAGALASSAPVQMFPGLVPCSAFDHTLTKAFRRESAACAKAIRKSWPHLLSLTDSKRKAHEFSRKYKMCDNLTTQAQRMLLDWMHDTYLHLAMYNYPEPSSRLTSLPANPVKEACSLLTKAKSNASLVDAVFKVMNLFFNHTGTHDCLQILFYVNLNPAWHFQTCTELVMAHCSDGVTDMFFTRNWDMKQMRHTCKKRFRVKPDPQKIYSMFGNRLETSSNIIFSNGELDPWSAVGYRAPKTKSVIPILIRGAAHQEDFRFPSLTDSAALIRARWEEKKYVRKWIDEAGSDEGITVLFDHGDGKTRDAQARDRKVPNFVGPDTGTPDVQTPDTETKDQETPTTSEEYLRHEL